MGPQDPQKLAEHIYRSVGPSGPNIDYLLSLEVALDNLSAESGDEHIKDLANRVRMIQAGVSTRQALDRELAKAGSTDEQEEAEKPSF
jgi:cation transport protein ChaC